MENKLRRGLALLMTLIMLISCAPMDALAAIVPVPGGTQTSDGFALKSIVKPPVATHTYVFMNGDTEFDTIVEKSGLNVVKVLSGITELEMQGVIEVLPGRKYKKI